MPETDHVNAGDPLPDVFPPDDPFARFVVSMAMAANDIDRALRDVVRAGDKDDPDFSYRVRLSVGHLVEALDALRSYTQEFPEVLTLIDRVSSEGQRQLSRARGSLRKAGRGVLASVRNNTFHYPSPDRRYEPPSDEQLRDALAGLPERGTSVRLNTETGALTYTFADDLAMAMTLGKTATTSADLMRQAGVARDGALAFVRWVGALYRTYNETRGHGIGDPIPWEKSN